jgi:hypothetical protein
LSVGDPGGQHRNQNDLLMEILDQVQQQTHYLKSMYTLIQLFGLVLALSIIGWLFWSFLVTTGGFP